MVKIKHFNSIPASFVEVAPQSDTDLYSRATLDVFYIGETADHRKFTRKFSDSLLQSLPYTPVVSHYNEESEDFEGHAAEQEIYGLVDPLIAPTYVEYDGATWARCSVILYTRRPDKVGDIASKIVGHAQSLELRSDTLKYKINRDAQGNFKNLEFLEGQFIGVSVLGHDQEPAFTGSAFFETLPPEVFARGKEMTITIPEFAKLSWGEKSELLYTALIEKYGDNLWFIADVYDHYIVYNVYDEGSNAIIMYRMKYDIEGEAVSFLSEPERVHPSYEKLEETAVAEEAAEIVDEAQLSTESENETETAPVAEAAETVEVMAVETEAEAAAEAEVEPEVETKVETEVETAPEAEMEAEKESDDNVEAAPETESTLEEGEKGSYADEKESLSATSSLSDAERLELEAYRQEKKIALIMSYNDMIAEADLKKFVDHVDEYEYDALKSVLDALYVSNARKKQVEAPVHTSFKWYPSTAKKENSAYSVYIKELLDK